MDKYKAARRSDEMEQLSLEITLPYNVEQFHLRRGAKLTIMASPLQSQYSTVRTEDGRMLLIDKQVLVEIQTSEHARCPSEPANDTVVVRNENELPDHVIAKGVKPGQRLIVSGAGEGLRKVLTPEGVILWATDAALKAVEQTA